MQLVDHILVGSEMTSFEFSSTGDGDYNTPLDGDADHQYLVIGRFIPGSGFAASGSFHYFPNTTPGSLQEWIFWGNSASVNPQGLTNTIEPIRLSTLVSAFGAAPCGAFRSLFQAKRDVITAWRGFTSLNYGVTSSNQRVGASAGRWTGTGNVTALTFRAITSAGAVQANGIGIGTEVWLFKIPMTPASGQTTITATGIWELVDYWSTSTDITAMSFGSSGDGTQLYAINGSDIYYVATRLVRSVANEAIFLSLNSQVETGSHIHAGTQIGDVNGQVSTAGTFLWRIGGTNNHPVGTTLHGNAWIWPDTGSHRIIIGMAGGSEPTVVNNDDFEAEIGGALWADSVTATDSIHIWAASAGGLGAGSEASLYRLVQTP